MSPNFIQSMPRLLKNHVSVLLTNLITQTSNTPILCCRIDRIDNVGIQMSTLCQCTIQGHLANLGTHCGLCKLRNGEFCVLNTIRCLDTCQISILAFSLHLYIKSYLEGIHTSKVQYTIQFKSNVICSEMRTSSSLLSTKTQTLGDGTLTRHFNGSFL